MAAVAGRVDLHLDADVLLLRPRRRIGRAPVVTSAGSWRGCCCRGVEEEEGAGLGSRSSRAVERRCEDPEKEGEGARRRLQLGEKEGMAPRRLLAGEEEGAVHGEAAAVAKACVRAG